MTSMIARYLRPDGKYEYNGIEYNSPIELVIEGFFGFCGCGQPEKCFEFIRNVLNMLDTRPDHDTLEREDWDLRWNRLLGSSEMFVLYTLTRTRIGRHWIVEHGSSIGGSWLTSVGKEFLEDLNKMKV